MQRLLTLDQVVGLMRKAQGRTSMRTLAASWGLTVAYISDIYAKRRDPGPSVLEKLGLERVDAPKMYRRKEL